jgi:hypothetical protein
MPVTEYATFVVLPLITEGTIPAGQVGITEAFYTGNMEKKTLYVKTTGISACTVYVLGGPDADHCNHLLVTGTVTETEDAARTWSTNNQAKCFQVIEHMAYMRLVIENAVTADVVANASLS